MFSLNRKTNIRTELLAALTTFFTMSYIFVINPRFLADAGMDIGGVFVATALSAGIATLLMGLFANRPFALASGMGLNSYFAYSIVLSMGFSWGAALAAVFVSQALIFLLMVSRIDIADAIPPSFKHALTAGLGFFLVFIGMQNAHFIRIDPATFVSLGDLTQPPALIAIIGFFIISALIIRKVPGGMFIGVLAAAAIAIGLGLAPLPEAVVQMPPDVTQVALKADFSAITHPDMLPVIWSLFIITFLDVIGTLTALSIEGGKKLDVLDKEITINSVGGMIGAMLGTSSVVTYLESVSGIEAGGKTGLTAIFIALLFFLSIFFFPLLQAIPIEAAAPVMIIVGEMMLLQIRHVKLHDMSEAIPALMTIAAIPFTFSISTGIGVGSIAFIFLKVVSGKRREVHLAMYLIALLSLLEFAGVF